MLFTLAHIGARAGSRSGSMDGIDGLIQVYLTRCSAFARSRSEAFRTEEAMLEWLGRQQGRIPAIAVLLDTRGTQMSSEAFAGWLGARRDEGAQHIVSRLVRPADGPMKRANERNCCCLWGP